MDFTTIILQVDLFSFAFWRKLMSQKKHFEINWPLMGFVMELILLHKGLFTYDVSTGLGGWTQKLAIFGYYQYTESGRVRKSPKTCLCNVWMVPNGDFFMISKLHWLMGNILVTVMRFAHAFGPMVPEILPDKWTHYSFAPTYPKIRRPLWMFPKGSAAKIRMTDQHNQNLTRTVDALFILFNHTSIFILSEILKHFGSNKC